MLDLKNVTLFMLDGVDPDLCAKAIHLSVRGINFGKVKLVTFKDPQNKTGIEVILIDQINQAISNEWMPRRLTEYVDTDFVLSIHVDGFVLNPHLWTDEFFKYDYLGAPWEDIHKSYDRITEEARKDFNYVGNGGFTLRSKKFIDLSAAIPETCTMMEDAFLCNNYKKYFVSNGVKFGTVEVAKKFSQDPLLNMNSTFGFHGDRKLLHAYA